MSYTKRYSLCVSSCLEDTLQKYYEWFIIIESDQEHISSELNLCRFCKVCHMNNGMHDPIFLPILEFIYNYISKLLISLNRFPFDQTTWQEWSKFSHRKFSQSKWWHHMQSRFQSQRILMPTFQASCLSTVSTSY
jgi:hypothetical protein